MRRLKKLTRGFAAAMALSLCLGSVNVQAADLATGTDAAAEQEAVEAEDAADVVLLEQETEEIVTEDVANEEQADTTEDVVDEEQADVTEDVEDTYVGNSVDTALTLHIGQNLAAITNYSMSIYYVYTATATGKLSLRSSCSDQLLQSISPTVYVYAADADGKLGAYIGGGSNESNRNFDYSLEVEKNKTYYIIVGNSIGGKYGDVPFTAQMNAYPNGWFTKDSKWYYVKDNAFLKNDWVSYNNSWYYFNYDGTMAENTIAYIADKNNNMYCYGFDKSGRMVKGWFQYQDDWYYFLSSGKGANGPVKVGTVNYYFYEGRMASDMVIEDDDYFYCIDKDGKIVENVEKKDGWIKLQGNWYYMKGGSLVYADWVKYNGKWYYFDESGLMVSDGLYSIEEDGETVYYGFDANGCMLKGWKIINNAWYYFDKTSGKTLEGVQTIDGVTYHFDYDGRMQMDLEICENQTYYYFNASGALEDKCELEEGFNTFRGRTIYVKNGALVYSNTVEENGALYYFDAKGCMARNQRVYVVSRGYTYFGADGKAVSGWVVNASGDRYYYRPLGGIYTGLQNVGGKIYYFDYNGRASANKLVTTSNTAYYFGSDSELEEQKTFVEGWNEFRGDKFYVLGGNLIKSLDAKLDGEDYTFGTEGQMGHDIVLNKYDSSYKIYYCRYGSDGRMIRGWYYNSEGGIYYYDEDGHAVTGLQTIEGKSYIFDNYGSAYISCAYYYNGVLYNIDKQGVATPCEVSKDGWVNDKWYIKNGKLADGWLKIDGAWYYFEDGSKRSNGRIYADDKAYMLDSLGRLRTGWILDYNGWMRTDSSDALIESGWKTIGTKQYYFRNYYAVSGIQTIDDELCLFDDDCVFVKKIAADETGWIKAGKKYYYVEDGKFLRNKYRYIDDAVYYFGSDSVMATNYYDSSERAYMGANGKQASNLWVELTPSRWIYVDKNGVVAHDTWMNIGGKWYYFASEYMVTGDKMISGKKYHFADNGVWDGKLYNTGWFTMNGTNYYMENGDLPTGWKEIDGDLYYLSNGAVIINSQMLYNGKWYYVGRDGKVVKNKWTKVDNRYIYSFADGQMADGLQTIGGKQYYFAGSFLMDKSGVNVGRTIFYETDADGAIIKTVSAIGKDNKWVQAADGKWLYIRDGHFVDGYQVIDGKAYFFHNKFLSMDEINGRYGYCSKNGVITQTDGWMQKDGKWYYLVAGQPIYGEVFVDGKAYYLVPEREDGIHYVDYNYYYFDAATGKRTLVTPKEGWTESHGQWIYMENGKLPTGMKLVGGKWYFFSNGLMMTNILQGTIDGNYVYFGSDGTMVKNKWVKNYNKWYYFDANGYAVKGKQVIDGKTYYFNQGGGLYE